MKQKHWILTFAAIIAVCLLVWLLPRGGGQTALVYQDGTLFYTLDLRQNRTLTVTGPCGNGFDTAPAGARPLLVGGGVGASPLYGLAQQLVAEGRSPLAVLGFRTAAEVLLADAFCALGIPVTVVTEDGTMGARGFVTEALPEGCTYVYACGPMPMLQALCSATPLGGQLSLEARMGCGFGACMGCTCETTHGSKRVCKDGPVFTKEEIVWPQQP